MNTYARIKSPHYLAWFFMCFANLIKTLILGFNPFMPFYLCCKCSTFLHAHTLPNAIKQSIEICVFITEGRDIYKECSALNDKMKMFYEIFLLNKIGLGRSTHLGGGEGFGDGLVYALWIYTDQLIVQIHAVCSWIGLPFTSVQR